VHNNSTLASAVNVEGHCVPDKYYRQKNPFRVFFCQQGSYSVSSLQQQVIVMVVVQVADKTG